MVRRLILMRHAKSSWDDARLADHDRVLNGRGIRACAQIGVWLSGHGYEADEAIVSSAARTQETWTRTWAALAPVGTVRKETQLYHADPETMLKVLRSATGRSVAMIGHNPGIAEFAARLLLDKPDHRDFRRYPTAATLVADFPIESWTALIPASGTTVAFTVPRDLD